LDAHTLLWAVDDSARLSSQATVELQAPANELLLSAGTVWELGIKFGLGKLALSRPFRPWMEQAVLDLGVGVVPISIEHVDVQAGLARHHGDPFDRLLVAQAHVERAAIVSKDASFDFYGIQRVW
jgi:PIN domain nuclease of toxin-antitoxin system